MEGGGEIQVSSFYLDGDETSVTSSLGLTAPEGPEYASQYHDRRSNRTHPRVYEGEGREAIAKMRKVLEPHDLYQDTVREFEGIVIDADVKAMKRCCYESDKKVQAKGRSLFGAKKRQAGPRKAMHVHRSPWMHVWVLRRAILLEIRRKKSAKSVTKLRSLNAPFGIHSWDKRWAVGTEIVRYHRSRCEALCEYAHDYSDDPDEAPLDLALLVPEMERLRALDEGRRCSESRRRRPYRRFDRLLARHSLHLTTVTKCYKSISSYKRVVQRVQRA